MKQAPSFLSILRIAKSTFNKKKFSISTSCHSEYNPLFNVNKETQSEAMQLQRNDDYDKNQKHIPVMVKEVTEILQLSNNKIILDMTFGNGGHSLSFLKEYPFLRIIANDRDTIAYRKAIECSDTYSNILPIKSKFSQLKNTLQSNGILPLSLDGVLMDIGTSSMQLDNPSRGFSFLRDGPLDMTMDNLFENSKENLLKSKKRSLAYIVNQYSEEDLGKIIKSYGEERNAKIIAKRIVEYRTDNLRNSIGPINSTKLLADIICSVVARGSKNKIGQAIHPATKTFQAFRIYINDELNELKEALDCAHYFLKENSPCAVITFHSLEDRIVKRTFHDIDFNTDYNQSVRQKILLSANQKTTMHSTKDIKLITAKKWLPISKKVLLPTQLEIDGNPRSRSAKLRAAFKLIVE